MASSTWTRTWCVNPVPFDATGSPDMDEYRRHVRFMVEGGVRGLVPLGLVGGGLQLTPTERDLVVTATIEAAGPDVVVYPAILDAFGSAELAERIDRYADLGAHGIYLGTSPFVRADESGSHALVDGALRRTATDLPIVCYDNSNFTGSRFGVGTALRLHDEHGRVAGYKQNDPAVVADVVAEVAGRFPVAPPCYDRFTMLGYRNGCTFQAAAGAAVVPRAVAVVSDLVGAGRLDDAERVSEGFAPLYALPEHEWIADSLALYAGIYCHLLQRQGFRFVPPAPFRWPLPEWLSRRLDETWEQVASSYAALEAVQS
ncbi:dihydrodipicolinate synthase family protein [Nocardioides sp. R-C-SC26]|uniref:dihydrodipicolinate synthase family protein n=1 Tax=Nocardioides sp. R-C-SC26 TaxID=2870414 RepID=UPI001E3B4575|nr:dihydrodipicolinate synthase family protein [Nocardioides sp. R-C-SC26]